MPKDEILDGSTWTDVQPQKEEILDGSTWTDVVKKKGLDDSKPTNTNLASPSLDGQSNGKLASSNDKKTTDFSFPDFSKQNIQGVTGTPVATQKQSKPTPKDVLGKGTTVKETTQTPIETPQYDVSGATKQQSDNTDTRLVNVSQQAESKRVAQEAEKVKREQELANPNSFQNIGTSYKEKALKTTGNNDIEKMLNFGDINGNKAFVEATLDDNDKHVLGVIKEIEKINNDNKIYEQQLKSGAITQEIYDAHKKENTKKSIDLNAEYVKGIQSRNSAIDDEIKQSQTKLANGYDIKMLGAQPYSEPLTTQQIDEEKKKIKTLTDLKNDVLIDVNNPVKSLEKHEGFQNAEKEGLIPNGATNTQKVRIYSYILADKAKKLATELGYNPNDVKSLMGDKFGSNTPKMFWESAKSLIFGSNPKEKEFVHTMAELQAIAPISILNKNNLNLNEGYTSNIVSSFRKSVAPMFPRNQIATDQDRNALTQEAFNQAGVNQDVNSAYTTQQGNVDKESKTIGKTVSRTAGDIFGIGVKVAGINTLLGIPGQAIEMAVGKPVIQGLDKALSTSKEAQALEYTKLAETTTKTASEAKKVEDAKKVLDVAKVVTEKLPNNFLTRTIYGTLKSGVVHEIQGRVNDELKGFANFGVGSVNHLIGMPINTLGQVAIKMFGKEAPLFVEKVIQAAQSGTAMTATMAGMTVVNAARETEDMSAFKDVLDQHFGTKEKALRFVAENFLLGLALHAVNANTVSGLFKSKYDEGYSKLSPEEKAKVDDFVKDTNEKANDFETATKDAVEQVQKDDHKPLTTDKEIEDGINEFKDAEKIPSLSVGDNKDGNKITRISEDGNDVFIQDKDGKVERYSPEEASKILGTNVLPENKVKTDESQIKPVEPTNAGQELNNGTGISEVNGDGAEAKQDAKIESAVIEIGGKIYEGKNHAEAILKAKADGQDISQVNRQAEGKFKLSDGTIIDRAEAKTRFGQDRSELIIPQDEAAKQANKDYAEITKGLKNEQTNQNTPEQQDNGNSTGMAGSEQNSEAVRTKSEQGKLSNEDKIQQNATTEVQKQITEVEKIISELEDNPNSPFHKLVNLDEQKQKLSELQKKEAEVKKESAQPVLPETKAQKAVNPRLSALPKKKEVPTEKVEEGVGNGNERDLDYELANNKTQVPEGKGSWRKTFNETGDAMRKKDILRAIAEISSDRNELNDILEATKGLPEGLHSEINYAVEHRLKSLAEKDTQSGIKEGTDLFPKDAGLSGKELVGDALDRIANKIGGKKNLTEQEKTSLTKDVTDLAKGLIQEGKATLDNVIDKIKEAIKKRFPDLDENDLNDISENIKQKVLFDEAFQWYKDNDYTYEEAKKELDDNDVDYNEQDLKDAWGIKENSEEENIGIKRRITDKRREELGLNAVTLPKIADNNSAMKVAKELVDSGDVNPMEIENELISNVENPAKAKASKEDVHIIQYRRLQLENKEKALLSNKIRLDEAIKSNPDDADAVAEYLINEENIKNNNADLDRNTTASRVMSNIFAGIGHGLQTEMNAAGEVQALIKKVRDSFGDNIPEDVKKRLDSLEQENKELKIKNEEIENKYNNVIPKEEADKHIIEAYEKGKKDGSAGSQPKKYTQKFNRIADAFERKFKSKPLILRDADGNEIKLTQNSIVAWDDIVKIGAEAIRKTGEVIDGVNAIIEHIKDQDWYKNLSPNSKDAVKQQYEDYFTGKENKKKEDGLKVTSSRIKEIIERRKSENENTTVDDVVEEINRDFPDATPRQIRDAISGYGTIKEGSQEPIDKEVRKIKRMAKYDSILEDISNGVRPDKTGFQRDTLEVDELDQLKKIREGLKKLPLSDADLSKKLKTAQDAIETRLRNQIESLEKQIQTGEKSIRNTKAQTTPEIERLKVIRDEKKAILDEAESLNRHGDTLQELKDIADETGDTTITKKTVDDGLIKDLIQAHIEKGTPVEEIQKEIFDELKAIFPDTTERQVSDAITKQGQYKSEGNTLTELQQQISEIKKQANLKTKIEDTEKGIIAQTKVKGEKSKEVERLQQQLAELKKQALNKYADVSAADLVKKYEAVERQIKKGDYIKQKTTRTKFESDINWAKNNKRLTDIKIELNKLKDKALENNKNTFMKTLDIFDKWSTRMLFFGTYAYQLKLAATAASSIIHKPIEDIVGGLIYNSTLKNIAKNAPIEGNTKSSAVNLKDYYAELLRVDKWGKGILQLASKGETSLDQQNNKYGHINFSLKFKGKTAGEIVRQTIGADHIPLIDLLTTDPHAMIKEPIKRATYKAAFNTYMDWVETNMGAEAVNDPLIIEVGKNVAFLKAKSEIFMGNAQTESGGIENQGFIDSLNGKISQLRNEAIKNAQSTYSNEKSKANADYAKASLAKFFVPIVKVPTNIIARAIKGNPVVLLRNIFKAIQINNDIEKGSAITNEHADAIIRDLKKGTVTSMYWFAGALLANSIVGGFWNPFYPDKKRKGKMPKINEMNLGQKKHGITDLMIHGAEHAPNVQAMMLGATFTQTLGYYNKNKKENLAYSFAVATAATANATADQHPIYSTVSDLLQATQNEHGLDKFGNNIKRRFDIKKKFEDLNPADYYKGKMHPADSGSGSDSGSSRGSDSRGTER